MNDRQHLPPEPCEPPTGPPPKPSDARRSVTAACNHEWSLIESRLGARYECLLCGAETKESAFPASSAASPSRLLARKFEGDPRAENPPGFVWSDEDERPVYQLYTAKETAENLGVSERTIRRWIKGGRLHAETSGGEFRIAQEDARAALAGSRAQRPVSLDAYVRWLEDENDRLWKLLEKAVSRG